MQIKRFISTKPSNFKITAFLVGSTGIDILTGEKMMDLVYKFGDKDQPVNITPFLENVQTVN